MGIRLAIVGLDAHQRDWIEAARALAAQGMVEIVGAGHSGIAAAKDLGEALAAGGAGAGGGVAAFDDLRKLLREAAPQVILLDRPENASAEFLTGCLAQKVGLFCLGPPVGDLAEARALATALEPRTALLYIWPRLVDTRAYRHCAQADEFVKPLRFVAARWFGFNYALAKAAGRHGNAVRSLSVLAWDAFATLIDLLGLPESVYATLRGTVGKTDHFGDLTGAAGLTLRFADQCIGTLTVSDRVEPWQRELLLLGQTGTLRLDETHYHFSDAEGKLIDEGHPAMATGVERAMEDLQAFIEQFSAAASPHRGWEHRLEAIAASMEAMLISHRTGQAESPERFLALRR